MAFPVPLITYAGAQYIKVSVIYASFIAFEIVILILAVICVVLACNLHAESSLCNV